MAELAKLSEEQQRVILPNGKRAVYLDRIGRGLAYLKLWGAVDSPRRGQQVISEKARSLFGAIRKVFWLRLSRRSLVPPVKQVPNLIPKNPFKRLKTTLSLLLMLLKVPPKSLLLRVSLNWTRRLHTIFWSACMYSPLAPSNSWWWTFCCQRVKTVV